MRLLQITVPNGQRAAVVDVLQDSQFGFTIVEGAGETADHSIVSVIVPADAVEHLLADLKAEGFDRSVFTVSLEAEFVEYEHLDEVQNQWAKSPNRLAPAALRSKAKDLRRNTRSYLWMMVLSAVVATAGLLVSSPAVVVGSMVIAPIVSPALTASVGVVRDDREMLVDSLHMQLLGLTVAVVTATATGWLFKVFNVVPVALAVEQLALVSLRLSPTTLALAVAVSAGAAGAYGLATKGQATIVGVMIAAALIPTAAAVGIGIAWGNALVAVGALALLVLSIVGVNVGGIAMLFYLEYRSDEVDEGILFWETPKQGLVAAGTLLLVAGLVLAVGVTVTQQSGLERNVNEATADVLDREPYQDLTIRSSTLEYAAPGASEQPTVTLTLVRTAGEDYPDLPEAIDRAITVRTDRDVTVQVRFVEYHYSEPDKS